MDRRYEETDLLAVKYLTREGNGEKGYFTRDGIFLIFEKKEGRKAVLLKTPAPGCLAFMKLYNHLNREKKDGLSFLGDGNSFLEGVYLGENGEKDTAVILNALSAFRSALLWEREMESGK